MSRKGAKYLGKAAFLLQVEEQLASIDVVHDHVEFLAGLEGIVEFDNKRVLDKL